MEKRIYFSCIKKKLILTGNIYCIEGKPSMQYSKIKQVVRKNAESRISGGGGRYRYPDIIATKGNITRFYQIGRTTASGAPVAREVRALRDLGKVAKTFFISYT